MQRESRQSSSSQRNIWPFLGVWLLILGWGMPVQAQEEATLETLSIELWPDYDQANVLVLLTGELAANIALPATITIPRPSNAQVNAVARITPEGVMTDDIDFTETADSIMLTTPNSTFRVEYYYPYTIEGDRHSFVFEWMSKGTVNQMGVSVQQPASATGLSTEPTATAVTTRQLDGLTYHTLPFVSVLPGQPYNASISYRMTSPALTAEWLQNQGDGTTAVTSETTVPTSIPNWPFYLAAVGTALIGIAMFWQAYNNRQVKQRPTPGKPSPRAGFCHNCGQPRQQGDQFCRHCGTALK